VRPDRADAWVCPYPNKGWQVNLSEQILIAVSIDLLIGDPAWFPHPVKLMGNLALSIEHPLRRRCSTPRVAGNIAAALAPAITAVAAIALLYCAGKLGPGFKDAVSIFLIYSGIAAGDLAQHASRVYEALTKGTLKEARRRVGLICGRDTDNMDREEITRAAVESVAENTVDGVTAPLFYAALAGPVGIMIYKAISTLDSTFGYKNEKYVDFGRLSAKLDDVVNFIPARMTGLLVALAARALKLSASEAFFVFWRDRKKHPSPNAGHTEAAFAGAMGVQLGGVSYYGGKISSKPLLGDAEREITPEHIVIANALMLVTGGLSLILFVIILETLKHA
jgi:adenosylcobinamide-phosphate synthase